jgi:hypothetical protein
MYSDGFLEQRAFGRAQHGFVIEPLHQKRHPGEVRLEPIATNFSTIARSSSLQIFLCHCD